MNYPSTLGGNWEWRMPSGVTDEFLRSRLYETNLLYGRLTIDPETDEVPENA
jgi:4-alpha-glucanotransferase